MTDSRAVRALTDITAVEEYAPGMVKVVSWSDEYILDLRGEGCACPDKEYNDTEVCKHEYAAMLATSDHAPTPFVSETRERSSPEVCTHSPGELPCFECYEGGASRKRTPNVLLLLSPRGWVGSLSPAYIGIDAPRWGGDRPMPNLTRRQYLTTVTASTLAAGGLASIALTDTADARVSMDSLDVADTERTLSSPPESVTLRVTGNYQLEGTTPDQSRLVLQLQHGGTTREPDEILHHSENIMSGSYTLTGDVLAHPEITAERLMPAEVNQAKATELRVRVVLLAVSDGSIQSEASVEDTASLSITKDGVTLQVSGEGSLEVEA